MPHQSQLFHHNAPRNQIAREKLSFELLGRQIKIGLMASFASMLLPFVVQQAFGQTSTSNETTGPLVEYQWAAEPDALFYEGEYSYQGKEFHFRTTEASTYLPPASKPKVRRINAYGQFKTLTGIKELPPHPPTKTAAKPIPQPIVVASPQPSPAPVIQPPTPIEPLPEAIEWIHHGNAMVAIGVGSENLKASNLANEFKGSANLSSLTARAIVDTKADDRNPIYFTGYLSFHRFQTSITESTTDSTTSTTTLDSTKDVTYQRLLLLAGASGDMIGLMSDRPKEEDADANAYDNEANDSSANLPQPKTSFAAKNKNLFVLVGGGLGILRMPVLTPDEAITGTATMREKTGIGPYGQALLGYALKGSSDKSDKGTQKRMMLLTAGVHVMPHLVGDLATGSSYGGHFSWINGLLDQIYYELGFSFRSDTIETRPSCSSTVCSKSDKANASVMDAHLGLGYSW